MQKNKLNLHIYGVHLLNPYKTVVSHLKVQIRTITLKYLTVRNYWFIAIAISIFCFSVLFSQWRSCDDTLESIFFKLGIFMVLGSLFDELIRQRFKPPRYRHMICIGKKIDTRDRSIIWRCYEHVRLENVIVWKEINIPALLKYLDMTPLKLFSNIKSVAMM